MADSLNGNCCDNKIGGQPEVILPLTDSVSVLCLTPLWEYPFNFTHLIETNVYKTDWNFENNTKKRYTVYKWNFYSQNRVRYEWVKRQRDKYM